MFAQATSDDMATRFDHLRASLVERRCSSESSIWVPGPASHPHVSFGCLCGVGRPMYHWEATLQSRWAS